MVRTLHEQNFGWEKGLDFSPEISKVIPPQTDAILVWEISVAWNYVPYKSKILVGEKGLDFSPEIARSGRHKLMQYNRVVCLGLVYRESAKRNISH